MFINGQCRLYIEGGGFYGKVGKSNLYQQLVKNIM